MHGAHNTVTGSIYLDMLQLFVFLQIVGIEQEEEKVEFCFNMSVFRRTSVKMYVVLCACDFLIGEWEEANQLRGPHKVQTSHQRTFPEGSGRVMKYLLRLENLRFILSAKEN
jgi:hypothetical protein